MSFSKHQQIFADLTELSSTAVYLEVTLSTQMKCIVLLAVMVFAVMSIDARSYGKRRPVVKPIVKPHICPDVPCPLLFIQPECRRDTYYIHKGVQCMGCPEDICRQWQGGAGQWQGGAGQWDNDLEFGRNTWPVRNNWRHGQNWQNGQLW